MHTSSVLTLFVCSLRALAIPSKIYGPIWSLAHAGGSKTPPVPTSITRQFPQFNTSQWEAYHCLTLNKLETIISNCAVYCEDYTLRAVKDGFGRDGCHPDDFPCHCANSQRISNIIESCIFPWLNSSATCTEAELGVLQLFVTDSYLFYNATQYVDYHGCGTQIDNEIYADIRIGSAPRASIATQKFSP